jgi:hypothetical protein
MKYFNAFMLLAIVLVSNANSFQFSSLKEVQALKTTVFGSNLIETISMTFQNDAREEAGKEVLASLNELKTQLNTDQKNDDDMFAKKDGAFTEHIAALAKEIQELTEEIAKLEAEIERLAGLIETATANIHSFEERIENLGELLVQMAEDNKADNLYYNEKIEDLGKLYNAFTQIIEKISLLKGSSSGVNKYAHINATESELRDIAYRKAHPTPAFVEQKEKKFMSFLQVTNQNKESTKMALKLAKQYTNFLENTLEADQAALMKLIGILSRIQDETLVKKSAAIEHLADINKTYGEVKEATEAEVVANKASLKKQTENRALYIEQKAKAEEEKANKEARRELLIKEKAINEKLQADLQATHKKEKEGRAEELNVVNILEGIVERRLLHK